LSDADDPGVRGEGGIGNIADHQRALNLFQQFEAAFEALGALRIGSGVAVAKPERKSKPTTRVGCSFFAAAICTGANASGFMNNNGLARLSTGEWETVMAASR